MANEHPFAQYIRIIGKGPRLSRPLTREEAHDATTMILKGEVDPVQLGAFLCILRVRSEDPQEGAGFIDAVRDDLKLPSSLPSIDLDWPSYAGKARQLPYYLLAALAMAKSGIKIFMHGAAGHTEGRLYTEQSLEALGIDQAKSLEDSAQKLKDGNFAYLPLKQISPVLQEIIDLKATLGVRTPVNTFARMINAFDAPNVMQCITHAAYREIHRDCADLLGQKRMCVFKGEGGEIERRAAKPVNVQYLINGERFDEEWPAVLEAEHAAHDTEMDISRLKDIWAGKDTHPYAISAITGTIAIALRLMDKASNPAQAQEEAEKLWGARNMDKIPYA
ncbi:Anthranilate phosphoribosyltransferase [Candidatus Terasakiella magnetica]|uniref:Anthranilate phosphoribosyltransferase n=1 Tax=Candidatus Terasakiella magnetica TaxID=1867952 RepID=A0A1C3RKA2_9PROT|nr:glycosyl transferase family protein [Candidatus Terasakiella magnetica]SCA57649.1 Anthranilate phosphoribosyltransferase [Candidatus Terasakiella magnetica]